MAFRIIYSRQRPVKRLALRNFRLRYGWRCGPQARISPQGYRAKARWAPLKGGPYKESQLALSSLIYVKITNRSIIKKVEDILIFVLLKLLFAPNFLEILPNMSKKLENILDYRFGRVET